MIAEPLLIEVRNRRSTLETDMDILKSTQMPIRLTALMYATAVNCSVLKSRLIDLENKGLIQSQRIKIHRGHNLSSSPKFAKGYMYSMTKKGLCLLSAWNNLQKLYFSTINGNEEIGEKK